MTNKYEKHFPELLNLEFSVHIIILSITVESCRVETVESTCIDSKSKVESVLLYAYFENTVDTLENSLSVTGISCFLMHGFVMMNTR